MRLKAESADEFNQRWGFQKVEVLDKVTKQPKQDWEDVDVFLARVEAHIEFYAAFMQSDRQRVHGIENAWRYLSWWGLGSIIPVPRDGTITPPSALVGLLCSADAGCWACCLRTDTQLSRSRLS